MTHLAIGKRSISDESDHKETKEMVAADTTYKTKEVVEEVFPGPIPFEHGPHWRQRRQTQCEDNSVQNVLFVLDTSGSIGTTQFNRMKNATAKLTPDSFIL